MLMIYTGQSYKYRGNSHDYPEIIYLDILQNNIVGIREETIRFHYNYFIYPQSYLIEKKKLSKAFKAVTLPYVFFAQCEKNQVELFKKSNGGSSCF